MDLGEETSMCTRLLLVTFVKISKCSKMLILLERGDGVQEVKVGRSFSRSIHRELTGTSGSVDFCIKVKLLLKSNRGFICV